MKIRDLLTWEDAGLAVLTLSRFAVPRGIDFSHVYTVGFMAMILRLGQTRGLRAAVGRTVIVSAFVFWMVGWKGQAHLANAGAIVACALLAGFLGDRQRRAQEALKRSFSETLEGLADALEARDSYTEGHTRRTAKLAVAIARKMGLDQNSITAIEHAGILHDVGKIGTPDAILRKNGSLTPDERRQMQQHPAVGHKILKGIGFLEEAAVLVRHHHEHYDGAGYPDGLAGTAIPLGARILTVADAFDALTTDRPYHKRISQTEAIRTLEQEAGGQFDPAVVEAIKTKTKGRS